MWNASHTPNPVASPVGRAGRHPPHRSFGFPTLVCALIPVLTPAAGLATEIRLKGGNRLSGDVVSETPGFIILDSDGSRITIARSMIAEIDGVPFGTVSGPDSAGGESGRTSADSPTTPAAASAALLPGTTVRIKLKTGTKLRGRVVAAEKNFVRIEIDKRSINVFRSAIAEVNGKPYRPAQPVSNAEGGEEEISRDMAPPADTGSTPPVRRTAVPPTDSTGTEGQLMPETADKAAESELEQSRAAVDTPTVPRQPGTPPRAGPSKTPADTSATERKSGGGKQPGRHARSELTVEGADTSAGKRSNKPDRERSRGPEHAPSPKGRPSSTSTRIPTVSRPAPPAGAAGAHVTITDVPRAARGPDTGGEARRPSGKTTGESSSLATLLERLRSPLRENRLKAVMELREHGTRAREAAPLLVGFLTDTASLRIIPPREHTPDSSRTVVTSLAAEAARTLAAMGPAAARFLPRVVAAAGPLGRMHAIRALGHIGDTGAHETILAALTDTSLVVREEAVRAVVRSFDTGSLVEALDHGEPEVRRAAARACGMRKEAHAVSRLVESLRDDNSYVRENAAWALGEIGDTSAVSPLTAALTDRISFVRHNAAEALGKIEDPRAMGPLSLARKDESDYVRERVEKVLQDLQQAGLTHHRRELDSLVNLLDTAPAPKRKKAARMLWLMTGKEFGTDAKQWNRWLINTTQQQTEESP